MKKNKLEIIYQDKNLIVINKPYNLLSISTGKEREKTLYHQVLIYEKTKNKNNKIFVIHRLDKDTSGIIIFAKNIEIKEQFQNNWNELVLHRKYVAVVEGNVLKKEDEIKSYLKENKNLKIYSSNDSKNGKLAITKYKLLNRSKSFSLLDIEILTGRKNQIRVHMQDINHPIIGDKKYGSKTNPLKRLGLHCYQLEIINPITKKTMIFNSEIPEKFLKMFPNK